MVDSVDKLNVRVLRVRIRIDPIGDFGVDCHCERRLKALAKDLCEHARLVDGNVTPAVLTSSTVARSWGNGALRNQIQIQARRFFQQAHPDFCL